MARIAKEGDTKAIQRATLKIFAELKKVSFKDRPRVLEAVKALTK